MSDFWQREPLWPEAPKIYESLTAAANGSQKAKQPSVAMFSSQVHLYMLSAASSGTDIHKTYWAMISLGRSRETQLGRTKPKSPEE